MADRISHSCIFSKFSVSKFSSFPSDKGTKAVLEDLNLKSSLSFVLILGQLQARIEVILIR